MSLAVLNAHSDELTAEHANASAAILASRHRRHIIKKKVIAIGRLSHQLSILRENPDKISEIKRLSSTGMLPPGTLSKGEQGIREVLTLLGRQHQHHDGKRAPNKDERKCSAESQSVSVQGRQM